MSTIVLPESDDSEREQRNDLVGEDAEQDERRAPEDDSECEVAREALARDERQCDGGSDQRPDAARGLQQSDTGVAERQEVEGRDDDEDAERAGDDSTARRTSRSGDGAEARHAIARNPPARPPKPAASSVSAVRSMGGAWTRATKTALHAKVAGDDPRTRRRGR